MTQAAYPDDISEEDLIISRQDMKKKTMKKRAEEAQSFDEKIGNLINMVKITMMPIVEGLTEALDPLVTELMNGKFKDDLVSLGKDIGEFVTWAAKGLGKFVSTVVDIFGAKGLFLTYLLGSSAKWIANGLLLAQGFLTGTRGFGGFGGASGGGPTGSGPTGGVPSGGTGRFGKFGTMKGGMSFGKSLTRGLGVSAIGGLASAGLEYGREQMEEPNSTGGKLLGAGAKAAEWASYGALIGSVIPGLGTGAGAIIGGLLGAGVGVYDEFNEPQDDAKFPKLGASHSKGRAILQGGKITPIHNKDEVLAMKPGGVVDKTINNQKDKDYTPTKIEFDDININGEIKITLPGGTQIGQEIMKSQEFRSSITRIVTSQLEKNRNGGKTQG
jgi:hypothetical protein